MALIQWCRIKGGPFNKCYAIPNGGPRRRGAGGRLKASGMTAGVPDLFWYVARGGFNGLFIEMKRVTGGVLSEAQKTMRDRLQNEGYRVRVCAGFEAAKAALEEYFGGKT